MDNTFQYNYSAETEATVEQIANKYAPISEKEQKLERMKKLDQEANKKPMTVALGLGILGALILGGGMSLCMVLEGIWFIPGIIIGLIGLAVVALAYPLYLKVAKEEKARIAPEILRLAEEIRKDEA